MMRACSSVARISASVDLPAPIGPSTAMYRGLLGRTNFLYPARFRRDKQLETNTRVLRPLRSRHRQTFAHRSLRAARERRVEIGRRLDDRLRDGAAGVDDELEG